MLQKIEIKNYKSLSDISLDLRNIGPFNFNGKIIKNNLINKAMILGDSGSGKTILSKAFFEMAKDVSTYIFPRKFSKDANPIIESTFSFLFYIDNTSIKYEYSKNSDDEIIKELLFISDDKVFETELNVIKHCSFEDLSKFIGKKIPFRYPSFEFIITCANSNIFSNSLECKLLLELQKSMTKIVSVEKSFSEYSLKDKRHIFYKKSYSTSEKKRYKLEFILDFLKVSDIKFYFLDEFDDLLDIDTARELFKAFLEIDTQLIFTSRNTVNVSNDLLRPDAYFVLT